MWIEDQESGLVCSEEWITICCVGLWVAWTGGQTPINGGPKTREPVISRSSARPGRSGGNGRKNHFARIASSFQNPFPGGKG
jgi:hypothetical protein